MNLYRETKMLQENRKRKEMIKDLFKKMKMDKTSKKMQSKAKQLENPYKQNEFQSESTKEKLFNLFMEKERMTEGSRLPEKQLDSKYTYQPSVINAP